MILAKSPNMEAGAELSKFSDEWCYRYHLNGKNDSKLGLFIKRNEDYKIVNFLFKTEIKEVVDDDFSSNVLIRTSLKDVEQVILDFRQVRVANKLHLSSRESIYVVAIDYFLSKKMIQYLKYTALGSYHSAACRPRACLLVTVASTTH